jgi:hypothetical protein
MGIGVFDTDRFDPTSPPVYGTFAYWPYETAWRFNTLDDGLADGTYYLGAFLDRQQHRHDRPASPPGSTAGS